MVEPLCCATCAHEGEHVCRLNDPGWPDPLCGLDNMCMRWLAKDDYFGPSPGSDNLYLRVRKTDLSVEQVTAVLDKFREEDGRDSDLVSTSCYYCGRGAKGKMGVDEHVVPVSRGGTAHRSNLVRACLSCNTTKSYMTASEFRRMLRARRDDPSFLFWGERSENAEAIVTARAQLGIDPIVEVVPLECDLRSENWDDDVGVDAL